MLADSRSQADAIDTRSTDESLLNVMNRYTTVPVSTDSLLSVECLTDVEYGKTFPVSRPICKCTASRCLQGSNICTAVTSPRTRMKECCCHVRNSVKLTNVIYLLKTVFYEKCRPIPKKLWDVFIVRSNRLQTLCVLVRVAESEPHAHHKGILQFLCDTQSKTWHCKALDMPSLH